MSGCGKAGPATRGSLSEVHQASGESVVGRILLCAAGRRVVHGPGDITGEQTRGRSLNSYAAQHLSGLRCQEGRRRHRRGGVAVRRTFGDSFCQEGAVDLISVAGDSLWRQQGKKTDDHKLLSDVYNWFTEGFDTKDLQEAKALLEELH